MVKRALICGVTGQDGAYLTKLLTEKGYDVWGTSRDALAGGRGNLRQLDVVSNVRILSMAPNDFRSVFSAIEKSRPDEIYYLSGQSSVGLSFEQPAETLDSIVSGMLNLLEAVRMTKRDIRIYHAGSSECFGDTGEIRADEKTSFQPRSPYAVAKASAHWLVQNYREAYGLYCCTGVLFNHESRLRPTRFVTRKIVHGAARIARGETDSLTLGNLDIARDWGWAPEYVDAMWRMLDADTPDDYVIATGHTSTLRDFVKEAFNHFGLSWEDHVIQSNHFARPSDIAVSRANPELAEQNLGWVAQKRMSDVVKIMCEAEQEKPTT